MSSADLFTFGGKNMLLEKERKRHIVPPIPESIRSPVHRYIDNTRISDYRTCPRYYWLRHIKNWVPNMASLALINGSCWHEAMNVVWAHAKDDIPDMALLRLAYIAYCDWWKREGLKDPDTMSVEEIAAIAPRGPQIAKEVLWHYIQKRRQFIRECEILDIERPFAIPLMKNEDGSVMVYYVGRLDKVFKHPNHGKLVGEHKTTSWYATDGFFRREWLDSFSPNSQVDGYTFSAHLLYGDIKGVWIDGALFHKKVFDGIKWIPIDRQFSMIDNWLDETYYWIGKIKDDTERFTETGSLAGTFPKNTGSCGNYGGCTYRDICRFVVDPSKLDTPPNGFKVSAWNPFDVLKLEKLELEPEYSDENIKIDFTELEETQTGPAQEAAPLEPIIQGPKLVQVFEEDGEWYGMFSDGSKREVLVTEYEMEADSGDQANNEQPVAATSTAGDGVVQEGS